MSRDHPRRAIPPVPDRGERRPGREPPRGGRRSARRVRESTSRPSTASAAARKTRRVLDLLEDRTAPLETILALRLCQLDFRIEDTPIHARVTQLYAELEAAGVSLRPPVYLSYEWGCPDRVPIIGVPFFLAHPRLTTIERQFVYEAEGETPEEAMRLLRHEAGHAFLYAHRIYRSPTWRRHFGLFSSPYEDTFRAIPSSRRYVHHLPDHYAQKHPDEDFAETFAVWVTPGSDWRRRYRGWPAIEKIHYVDRLVRRHGRRRAVVEPGPPPTDSLPRLRRTLGSHYRGRLEEAWHEMPTSLDPELLQIFRARVGQRGVEPASALLRSHRDAFVDRVTRWTGARKYRVRGAVDRLLARVEQRHLALRPEQSSEILLDLTSLLTRMVTNEHLTGSYLGRKT